MPRATYSIEDAIKRGGRIVECRPHETRNKFSVKVVMPSEDTEKEQTLTYTNISSHLISMFSRTSAAVSRPLKTGNTVRPAKAVAAKSRKVETAASPVPNLEIPKSPEIADRSGFGMSGELRISPTDDFEKYAVPHIVYLRMLDGQIEVFGNVSKARIEAIQQYTLAKQNGWLDGAEEEEPEDLLDACVKKGGTIFSFAPFPNNQAQAALLDTRPETSTPVPEIDFQQLYAITSTMTNPGLQAFT